MIYFLVVLGIFACSCSQILLKRSAQQDHKNILSSVLNKKVIFSYSIMFASMAVNIYAMSCGVGLKEMPILESVGYIFVPLLSIIFLKEKVGAQELIAMMMIIIGILIFYV